MTKKKTKDIFEKEANIVHNSKYNYSQSIYINNRTKLKIVCPNNHKFEQSPNAHILQKQGCPYCAGLSNKTTLEFIEKANKIHNFKYDYSSSVYINARTKVRILCHLHGEFEQIARNHTNSAQGCSKCGREITGWTKTSFKNLCLKNNQGFGILYILKCFNDNEEFYKIGITSRSIQKRYGAIRRMPYKYEIIQEIQDSSENIYNLEKLLHSIYDGYKYTPENFFQGHTECFKLD